MDNVKIHIVWYMIFLNFEFDLTLDEFLSMLLSNPDVFFTDEVFKLWLTLMTAKPL